MKEPNAILAAVFRLLPVGVSDGDLAGADEEVRRGLPSNFAAVALNGLCFPTAGRILGAGLLLTWFVSDLTASAFWVGLIVPIQYGLALAAQPVVAEWLTGKPRRAPYYTAQSLFRAALWCSLGLASWALRDEHRTLLLAIFFLIVVADAAAAGVGNIAFNDTLARVIPRRLRGRARSWRGIFGSVAAGLAGLLIRYYFSGRSGVAAFGLLFAAAGALYAAGGLIFALVSEPEAARAGSAKPRLSDLLRRVRGMVRHDAFRLFVLVESLLVPLAQALPFFTLFARRAFKLEVEALGLLVLTDALTPLAGNAVWGRVADARGNRFVFVAAPLTGLLAPALCLLLYARSGGLPGAWAVAAFAAVVFTTGFASVGIDLAAKNYILDLAPGDAERPVYIGVNDTLVGLPTVLLAGAGFIIDAFGFAPVFGAVGLLAAGGTLLAARLPSFNQGRS
jgi:MFS family permease